MASLYNGRGSVSGLAGAEGTITASCQYDPSGSLTFGAAAKGGSAALTKVAKHTSKI